MPAISKIRPYKNGTVGNDSLAYQGFTMPFFFLLFKGIGCPAFRQLRNNMPGMIGSAQSDGCGAKLFPIAMEHIVMRAFHEAGNQHQ